MHTHIQIVFFKYYFVATRYTNILLLLPLPTIVDLKTYTVRKILIQLFLLLDDTLIQSLFFLEH